MKNMTQDMEFSTEMYGQPKKLKLSCSLRTLNNTTGTFAMWCLLDTNEDEGVGDTARQLRALSALREGLSLVPSPMSEPPVTPTAGAHTSGLCGHLYLGAHTPSSQTQAIEIK